MRTIDNPETLKLLDDPRVYKVFRGSYGVGVVYTNRLVVAYDYKRRNYSYPIDTYWWWYEWKLIGWNAVALFFLAGIWSDRWLKEQNIRMEFKDENTPPDKWDKFWAFVYGLLTAPIPPITIVWYEFFGERNRKRLKFAGYGMAVFWLVAFSVTAIVELGDSRSRMAQEKALYEYNQKVIAIEKKEKIEKEKQLEQFRSRHTKGG